MKKSALETVKSLILPVLIFFIIIFFLASLQNLDKDKAFEDKKQLENALLRAAVSCYAIEGAYPPSLEYLTENYSVVIDEKNYTVIYELLASNLMPDITVIEN